MYVVHIDKLDWVPIYFTKQDDQYQCNVCQVFIEAFHDKDQLLLEHMEKRHREIYDLHKNNPDETVGFRIEFLQLNDLNEESRQAVALEVDGAKKDQSPNVENEVEFLLVKDGPPTKISTPDSRKRSWVWKYFEQLNKFIFRCTLCNIVLSIKTSNTNNMNRHFKSKHPQIYKTELLNSHHNNRKKDMQELTEVACEVEIPNTKGDELTATTPRKGGELSAQKLARRSWVWKYFMRVSPTIAQCKLCNRKIVHGGNATGNMNRHLKFLHKDVYIDTLMSSERREVTWVWKLFSTDEANFYSCKICNFKCLRYNETEKTINFILLHLKEEHGVVSGDQIISGPECETSEMDECTVAVDFLKGAEEM